MCLFLNLPTIAGGAFLLIFLISNLRWWTLPFIGIIFAVAFLFPNPPQKPPS